MLRTSRRRAGITFTVAAALLLSACGDGIGPGDSGPPAETVARVDVSAPATTLAPQQAVQFSAVARSASGSAIGTVTPSWTTTAAGVATVNASGLVTGVAPGTATIRAAASGVSGSVTVTVTSGAGVLATLVTALQDPTVELGQQTQATVSGRDAGGADVALGARTVTWTTSNAAIARISSAGVVVGVGVGAVDIQVSVTDGATPKTGTVRLIVTGIPGAATSVDVFMPGLTFSPFQAIVKQGGTVRFIFPSLAHDVLWDRRLAGAPLDIGTTSNATIARAFPAAGVFDYRCTLHPGMDGQVIVTP